MDNFIRNTWQQYPQPTTAVLILQQLLLMTDDGGEHQYNSTTTHFLVPWDVTSTMLTLYSARWRFATPDTVTKLLDDIPSMWIGQEIVQLDDHMAPIIAPDLTTATHVTDDEINTLIFLEPSFTLEDITQLNACRLIPHDRRDFSHYLFVYEEGTRKTTSFLYNSREYELDNGIEITIDQSGMKIRMDITKEDVIDVPWSTSPKLESRMWLGVYLFSSDSSVALSDS